MKTLKNIGIAGGYIFVLWLAWGAGVWCVDKQIAAAKAYNISILEQVRLEIYPMLLSQCFRGDASCESWKSDEIIKNNAINARVDEVEKQYQ